MKKIAFLLFIAALAGCKTRIQPAHLSAQDKEAIVAAVYCTGIRTNGLSVYYAETYTRGSESWVHVLFRDAKEPNPSIHPIYNLQKTADGWKVVNKTNN